MSCSDTKTCKSCNLSKSLDLFYKHATGKDGHRNNCIPCHSTQRKQSYITNKSKIIQTVKEYQKNNKEKISISKKQYREENKEEIQKYRNSHIKERAEYRIKNKDKINKTKKQWLANNPEYFAKYNKKRRAVDINFKLSSSLRHRLYMAIKGNFKSGSAVKDLGCTIEQLKLHLKSKFQFGMNWNNYGEWHIDHIIPLSSFNLDNRDELLKACNYTNLQPMWAHENISKGAK